MFFSSACTLIGGCSTHDHPLVPATGTVILDGKPLTLGVVIATAENGRDARGDIAPDGSFSLETRPWGQGALVGVHRVSVKAYKLNDPSNPESMGVSLVPAKYTNAYNSGISIEVTEDGENDFRIELSSKPRRP